MSGGDGGRGDDDNLRPQGVSDAEIETAGTVGEALEHVERAP